MPSSTKRSTLLVLMLLLATVLLRHTASAQDSLPRARIEFTSSVDGSKQAAYIILPQKSGSTLPVPMVVSLHTWSGNMEQRNTTLERAVHEQGWIYLFPNFRGINRTPAACGSRLAQQDILDAVDWVIARQRVDKQRIYLTGASGGGHMTMLMAGRYPDRWRAASAFVGISDLARWHAKHQGQKYGNMLEACCGGAPGDSAAVDAEYQARSPLTYIANAKDLAIDLAAGINDGHSGSVPIKHSVDAFNQIAAANGTPPVSDRELAELSLRDGRLSSPTPTDVGFDESFGRKFFLRRMSGNARLTIFDGGHEGITTATIAWFTKHATNP